MLLNVAKFRLYGSWLSRVSYYCYSLVNSLWYSVSFSLFSTMEWAVGVGKKGSQLKEYYTSFVYYRQIAASGSLQRVMLKNGDNADNADNADTGNLIVFNQWSNAAAACRRPLPIAYRSLQNVHGHTVNWVIPDRVSG